MKNIEEAIQSELERLNKKPEEIEELVLDNKCKSTVVKGLDAFTELRVLSLAGLGLTTLEGFPSLPKLVEVNLSDNKISSGLEHLSSKGLDNLEKLDLANNRLSTLSDLEPLKTLNLISLDLLDCPVMDKTPKFQEKVFELLEGLQFLNGFDKQGKEVEGEEDEEESEEDEAADESSEGEDEGEKEPGSQGPEYAVLVANDQAEEDEEDYEEEGEDDDDEEGDDEDEEGEDEEEEEAVEVAGTKRKRDEVAEEEEED